MLNGMMLAAGRILHFTSILSVAMALVNAGHLCSQLQHATPRLRCQLAPLANIGIPQRRDLQAKLEDTGKTKGGYKVVPQRAENVGPNHFSICNVSQSSCAF